MDYKELTREVYDKSANQYEKNCERYLKEHIWEDANLFVLNLKGKRVLDLGSGPGRDSKFFKKVGLRPICFDISSEMIRLCKKKDLTAVVGDFENIPYKEETFYGVWAYNSLLHLPKSKFPSVLDKIPQILKPKGIFYLGMKGGNFEGWKGSRRIPGEKRFYSLYSDKELKRILDRNFDILSYSVVSLESNYLNYLCQKKN